MKYSLRSLMVVVTLVCVGTTLIVRSRHCAVQARIYRQGLLSLKELDQAEAEFCEMSGPAKIFIAKQRCNHQFAAAYERVAYFPLLPLILPNDAPLKVPYQCGCGENLELSEKDRGLIEESFFQ
jgi:hypothetical protein